MSLSGLMSRLKRDSERKKRQEEEYVLETRRQKEEHDKLSELLPGITTLEALNDLLYDYRDRVDWKWPAFLKGPSMGQTPKKPLSDVIFTRAPADEKRALTIHTPYGVVAEYEIEPGPTDVGPYELDGAYYWSFNLDSVLRRNK